MNKKPARTNDNPYSQVSLKQIKIWGRLTGYETNISNKFLPHANDKVRLNKLLLEMGVPTEIFNYYEEGNLEEKTLPIDEATLETLLDLKALREEYLRKEDFEGLKQLSIDIKRVVHIGRKIFKLQKELEFVIAKQKYEDAISLKEQIKIEGLKRDKYDALYETRRFL